VSWRTISKDELDKTIPVKPTINGYQLMKAPIKANTAPILKT